MTLTLPNPPLTESPLLKMVFGCMLLDTQYQNMGSLQFYSTGRSIWNGKVGNWYRRCRDFQVGSDYEGMKFRATDKCLLVILAN